MHIIIEYPYIDLSVRQIAWSNHFVVSKYLRTFSWQLNCLRLLLMYNSILNFGKLKIKAPCKTVRPTCPPHTYLARHYFGVYYVIWWVTAYSLGKLVAYQTGFFAPVANRCCQSLETATGQCQSEGHASCRWEGETRLPYLWALCEMAETSVVNL